jgi:hypothetical protein
MAVLLFGTMHDGVDGWPGIGIYFVLHLEGGFAEDGGANSRACAYDALSSFG